jgi:hypothetical protein
MRKNPYPARLIAAKLSVEDYERLQKAVQYFGLASIAELLVMTCEAVSLAAERRELLPMPLRFVTVKKGGRPMNSNRVRHRCSGDSCCDPDRNSNQSPMILEDVTPATMGHAQWIASCLRVDICKSFKMAGEQMKPGERERLDTMTTLAIRIFDLLTRPVTGLN